jgi:predicted HTH domain antitoxin
MSEITINLPEEILSARRLPPEEFVRDMRLAAAIYWYQKGEISQEKAASVAGLKRRDFLAALAQEQVEVFTVDFNDLQRELGNYTQESHQWLDKLSQNDILQDINKRQITHTDDK